MKTYKLFIRFWGGLVIDLVQTEDIYHEIGKLYSTSSERIERVDYKVLKCAEACPIYEPCCAVCQKRNKCIARRAARKGREKESHHAL